MFGSTSSFGKSSSSPLGSQSVFGQNNNPFTPKPFGSASPLVSQTGGGSVFGGTSTGMFGASQSSTPTFGASSSPAFGSSVPLLDLPQQSTPAFGSGSSSFGGSAVFGQKPANGGFGSTPSQTKSTPFGGTFQQTQSSFGRNQYGSSTTFGSTSTPAFGTIPTAFGFKSTPMFGSANTPTFGSKSTSAFGSTGSTLGVSNAPAFGSGVFGTSSAPAFVSSSTSAFGTSSTPAFGSSSTPAFAASTAIKASSSQSFGFGSSPTFGQSNSTLGSSTSATPALVSTGFGKSAFGDHCGGSRVNRYSPTPEVDGVSGKQTGGKLQSISGMPVYKDKSHEELRLEDYHLRNKVLGGPDTAVNTGQSNPCGVLSTIGLSSTSVFPSTTSSNPILLNPSPFGTKFDLSTPAFTGIGSTSSPHPSSNPFPLVTSPFGITPSSSFSIPSSTGIGSTSSQHPQPRQPLNLSPISTMSPCEVSSSSLIFRSNPAPGSTFSQTSSGLCNTQPAGGLQSNTPSLGQTTSAIGQTGSTISQRTSSFVQPNLFNTPSISGGEVCSSSSMPSISPSAVSMQPTLVSNPFGTLPVVPQMLIGRSGSSPTVQYGISSMPIIDKPAPVRVSSLLTSRHLYQRRSSLPARKYHPKNDAPKVPFYHADEEPSLQNEDALFVPRENARALVVCSSLENLSPLKNTHASVHRDAENRSDKEHTSNERTNAQKISSSQKTKSYITLSGHVAGKASIVYEHETDVEALMPKLKHADYYTEPCIQELAAKERVEPGFCQHVKNFVVGRRGYGSIKFIGETDVRGLDLESLVQFNDREVIVYMDDSKKPPLGQGLNKPAELTLLNIKCFDKKTGLQYTEGPKLEKCKEMLTKKAQEQKAEFVSYDPLKGEWIFSVKHF